MSPIHWLRVLVRWRQRRSREWCGLALPIPQPASSPMCRPCENCEGEKTHCQQPDKSAQSAAKRRLHLRPEQKRFRRQSNAKHRLERNQPNQYRAQQKARGRQMVVAEGSWGEHLRLIKTMPAQQGLLTVSQPIIIPLRFHSQTFESHKLFRVQLAHKLVLKSRRPTKLPPHKFEIDRSEVRIEII